MTQIMIYLFVASQLNNFAEVLLFGHPNWRHELYSYNCLSLEMFYLLAADHLCVWAETGVKPALLSYNQRIPKRLL